MSGNAVWLCVPSRNGKDVPGGTLSKTRRNHTLWTCEVPSKLLHYVYERSDGKKVARCQRRWSPYAVGAITRVIVLFCFVFSLNLISVYFGSALDFSKRQRRHCWSVLLSDGQAGNGSVVIHMLT